MQINLEVIQVKNETKVGKNDKPYQVLEIAYKNLGDGKITAKKMTSYGEKSVYEAFVNAKSGEVFTVTSEKVGDFWEWKAVSQTPPGLGAGAGSINKPASMPSKSPVSTYETKEERAQRQVHIAKTSGLSNAITVLSIGAKTPPDTTQILALAQKFTDHILNLEFKDMNSDLDFDAEVQ